MSEHEGAAGGSEPAAAEFLGPALDEIRWRHPTLRASCGAFVGPAIRILETSHPEAMSSLKGIRAVGAPVTALAELLKSAQHLTSTDVHEHPALGRVHPTIFDADTRAFAIVPLHADLELIGFLSLDASRSGEIDRRAVQRLHEMAPMASVAILLEQQRVCCQAHISRVQQLRASICRQSVRERQAGIELQQAIEALCCVVESVAPKLESSEHLELLARLQDLAGGRLLDAGRRASIDHELRMADSGRESASGPSRPQESCETGRACDRSSDGTPG